jgi:hypothetical protein
MCGTAQTPPARSRRVIPNVSGLTMHQYLVLDANARGKAVAVCDSEGKYHLVRTTAEMPAVGSELHGAGPGSGFRLLLAVKSGKVFGAVFDLIDCGEKAARRQLRR